MGLAFHFGQYVLGQIWAFQEAEWTQACGEVFVFTALELVPTGITIPF